MTKSVSVVIPCRNEELYIERCVGSLMASDYPKELFEVIVSDGESDDATLDILQKLKTKYSNLVLIPNPAKVTPVALNLGLKHSKSDIKIILGAHSEVAVDFISENVNALESNPKVGCAGGVLNHVYEDETAELIGLAMTSPFGVGNAGFRTGAEDGYVDTVAFGAYKKEVFDSVGYFDETLVRNQDDEFNFRVTQAGFKILLCQKINCKYFVRASFGKLWRQYLQYGYWKIWVNLLHNTVTTWRQLVPLFFVIYLILGLLITPFSKLLGGLYFIGLAVYLLAASLTAFKLVGISKKMFQLVWTFLILHTSYGYGYLVGLIRFVVLRQSPSPEFGKLSR